MAAGYHTVFFINNRTKLLRSYCFYLLTILIYCFYCLFRMLGHLKFQPHFIDEILQMIICLMYARFLGVAINVDRKKNKWSIRFLRSTPFAVVAYIILLKMALDRSNTNMVYVLMGAIRGYFFLVGVYLLIMTLRKKKSAYYYLVGSGAIVLIVFAIISTLVEFYYLAGNPVKVRGLSWLLMGFFAEVIFYSAAVGYRTKRENLQRIAALQKIVDQYDIIKQHEIEKLKAMYQSKEEERNRIVKDIHDEIGSTVSSISILSNVALQEKDKKDTGPMMKEIRDNAATLTDKVDDIVWSMNPRHDFMESLLLRIRQFATPLFEAKGIDYEFDYGKELMQQKIDAQSRQYIYYILKEAINNLVKYSDCKKAMITASADAGMFYFTVKDDGKGFNKDESATGNGLHFMQQRAAEIGAAINIRSIKEKGTEVHLSIKIR
jgi:signal transduction histidine kinase